ncbi:conserved hypothetical protein [Histoplasma capsulatum G186AR]|uniref:Zn(2)-C6 fungal-type domain-containing protein n=2 Tax=Ajellomyces capsulatus TaxID=5037 RepID=C0NWJ5_AJECG|nr:uncharacterized protein HCBG_07525 [Histoplasma capsulatum G186AR]EEH04300.1 conserved hypothetical protein [Histoplasma capsulatum G186AR]KAG5291256.1 C6 finger domain-containing protein [Histoplasma capsulatum]QSS68559.1 C6 finger domain-containing protein [Histoplasma capsulatum G186AR]
MELRSLLTDPPSHPDAARIFTTPQHRHSDNTQSHVTMMASAPPQNQMPPNDGYSTPPDIHATIDGHGGGPVSQQPSPSSPSPKHVAFELLLDENSKVRARIPMRVQIFPHDTTDSIVTTVKNFYGIYEGAASGVSFEDENGNTLIARYENLRNNMTVYVRVISCHNNYPENYTRGAYYSPVDGYQRPTLGEPFQHQPQHPAQALDYGKSLSRPHSRVARKRSRSPASRSRRSVSAQKVPCRSGIKSHGSSTHGSFHDDSMGPCSDNDDDHGSMTGSKKARSEQFASSEISMDNILQDGRRKRPKFDSSELPLFVPPQVPLATSTSSISPQRRSTVQEGPSPFMRPVQRPCVGQQHIPSPQAYGRHDAVYGFNATVNNIYSTPAQHGHRLRDRTNTQSVGGFGNSARRSNSNGILPTPDPTIASCISDEDVAMQLIRLGDVSNFSHGRTSASTLDDAFSGAADASSTGATTDGAEASEDDDDLPPRSRQKLESSPLLPPGFVKKHHKNLDEILPSCDSSDPSSDDLDGNYQPQNAQVLVKNEHDNDAAYEDAPKAKRPKVKTSNSTAAKTSVARSSSSSKTKANKNRPAATARKSKVTTNNSNSNQVFAVPATLPPMASPTSSRKISSSAVNFQHQLGVDEEDLSTKPRCQRCRKSKKGCDRQRPCQRCKDAGIGIEGCISEDEGNGRKGRYGRHMGVPVKKNDASVSNAGVVSALGINEPYPHGANERYPNPAASSLAPALAPTSVADKNKKRKR